MTTTPDILNAIERKYATTLEANGVCGDRCNHPADTCGAVQSKKHECSMNDKNCDDCTDKVCESCIGNCTTCLDQIHYHWERPNVRTTYDCQKLVYQYVVKYIRKYESEVTSALNYVDISGYPHLNILSLACGVAPDLIAIHKWAGDVPVNYTGIDPNELWVEIQTDVKSRIESEAVRTVCFQQLRASGLFKQQRNNPCAYNAVVVQYLISAFESSVRDEYACRLFDGIIETILPHRVPNSKFLIILSDTDSIDNGRPCFNRLITKLETVGFSGTAIARSAHSTGDLGQSRWGNPDTLRRGAFAYSYKQIGEHEPAQLIIEVN